ncbi:hypothetical protein MU0083_002630 [[Mycobacterium] kokjensenii]|uniref:DUF3551 domain-containing protein n=1 Tax=[Mycobacterium] kokjensenii TaxID=3064287 RepID=A0ABN9N6E1_9MYCO|nr:hypothetical protein MU0083_002630 [Mycolicibacter sp. MU0083]
MNVLKKTVAMIAAPGFVALALTLAPAASANPGNCAGGGGWPGFGMRCTSLPYADGSYDQCDRVNVLGFGGTNCYRVYPPR